MFRRILIWGLAFLSLSLAVMVSSSPVALETTNAPAVEEARAIATAPKYVGPTTNWHYDLAQAIKKAQLAHFYEEAHKAELDKAAAAKKKQIPKVSSTTALPSSHGGGSHKGYSTARECVSMTENGGSYARSSNPTHKGRFQFGRPAWISFGGVPEHWDDWDLATPAEQDSVFDAAWSQGPAVQTQQWLRWDGCGPPDG